MNYTTLWSRFNVLYRSNNNFYHLNLKVMASTAVGSSTINNVGNLLALFINRYSFYSQKVHMALVEKKIPFITHDVAFIDQYQASFLQLNPRGEVPVLVDGIKVIPDSSRIIDYLEDNFSNGNIPRLIPNDLGPQVRQKIEHYRSIIDSLPANQITVASLRFPEISRSPKFPYRGPGAKYLINYDDNLPKSLRDTAKEFPQYREILLQKADAYEKNKIYTKQGYQRLLTQTEQVLNEVENELESHKDDHLMWLLCDRFTVADISLAMILERLYLIGLDSYFWANGKKPNIENYYNKIKERESYKKTVPNMKTHLKTILMFEYKILLLIGALVAAFLLYRKFKSGFSF